MVGDRAKAAHRPMDVRTWVYEMIRLGKILAACALARAHPSPDRRALCYRVRGQRLTGTGGWQNRKASRRQTCTMDA